MRSKTPSQKDCGIRRVMTRTYPDGYSGSLFGVRDAAFDV